MLSLSRRYPAIIFVISRATTKFIARPFYQIFTAVGFRPVLFVLRQGSG